MQKPEDNVAQASAKTCSCPRNNECPFNGICLDKNVQYCAELTSDLPNYGIKIYKGICATTFKERLGNHKLAFNHECYEANCELAKEVWRIKRKGGNFFIKWYKERNHPSYKPETKRCSLCDNEKLAIALYEGNNLLNKRNEIISRCVHRHKYKLKNAKLWPLTSNIIFGVIGCDVKYLTSLITLQSNQISLYCYI